MKIILLPLFFVGLVLGFSNMVHAERIYLYKDIKDKNPEHNKLYRYRLDSKIDPAISVNFNLPTQMKDEKGLWFAVNAGVKPLSKVMTGFKFKIDQIRIRDEKGNYAIYPHKSAQRRYGEKITIFDNGEMFGREPFEFNIDNTFGASFGVKIEPPLPETLYLDYKLRIDSAEGEKDLLEGTFVMKKTYYIEKPKNPFFR